MEIFQRNIESSPPKTTWYISFCLVDGENISLYVDFLALMVLVCFINFKTLSSPIISSFGFKT
jgi:hypothetical protein